MKELCNGCTNQEAGENESICGIAEQSHDEGYGSFKQGCVCIHDDDLTDKYSPRTGHEISIYNHVAVLKKLKQDKQDLLSEVSVLKSRLTKI